MFILFAVSAFLTVWAVAPSQANPRPNILFMTADDMHWDSVGVYQSPVKGITPHLDRLAKQGFMFRHAYVQIAICTPSRQVMLSGNHSHQTITRCFTPVERIGPTLPDVLKENSYYLANINKRQNHYPWDTRIDEEESACGRDVSFYNEALTRIIKEARGRNKPFFIIGYYYRNLRQTNMFPTFTFQTRDQAYIYNPWSTAHKEVHNSDYTHSRTLAAMWNKAQTDHAVKRRVDFHKFRVMEEFYDYAQDPYAFANLIHDLRYQSDIKQMKEKLQAWMAETDHPAAALMKDPLNQDRIDQYMQYEFENAKKQIAELKQGR